MFLNTTCHWPQSGWLFSTMFSYSAGPKNIKARSGETSKGQNTHKTAHQCIVQQDQCNVQTVDWIQLHLLCMWLYCRVVLDKMILVYKINFRNSPRKLVSGGGKLCRFSLTLHILLGLITSRQTSAVIAHLSLAESDPNASRHQLPLSLNVWPLLSDSFNSVGYVVMCNNFFCFFCLHFRQGSGTTIIKCRRHWT